MSAVPEQENPHVTRSEVEMAADTIAAIFGARLVPMTRGTVSEMSIATGVPVRAIKDAWGRRDAGLWHAPTCYPCDEVGNEPRVIARDRASTGRRQNNQPKPQAIPNDATEWVCRQKDCHAAGKPQPIACFEVRADTGTRRTTCQACRKKYNRHRYLSVETSERLGTILRFVLHSGDDCEGDACNRCHGPLLAGQEVETDDVLLVHHLACPDFAP